MSASSENVDLGFGLDEAKSLNLRQKVLNMYDNLGISLASDYINIRSSPEEKGIDNIIGKFPGYGGCNILGEENGWFHIKSGQVEGYVRADLLATGQTAQDLAVQNAHVMALINTQSLNVRAQASTDSEAWTQVTNGQRYDVVNQMDGWVELDLGDGDDSDSEQGSFVSTRDNNVSVTYALQEAIEYYPAVEAANAAAAFRNKIVNYACQFVGNPYVWGGTSLTHGCDCSGFVQSVLKNYGIYLPRVSRDQAGSGVRVTSDTMRPGDLVFYANRSGTINHVGMYIGNGQIVNAASRRSGIRIYRWNYRTPVAIRNVIGD
jgi:cell wall-associated NlpC family hydrolase